MILLTNYIYRCNTDNEWYKLISVYDGDKAVFIRLTDRQAYTKQLADMEYWC